MHAWRECANPNRTETQKDWSLSEWINNFIQDDGYFYDDGLYDDIYDDTMPGGDAPHYPGDDDDSFVDTLIIMGLALSLAFFVYYRQQRERDQQQQQRGNAAAAVPGVAAAAPQNNGGLFPPPGDPNFAQWAAGGVGH